MFLTQRQLLHQQDLDGDRTPQPDGSRPASPPLGWGLGVVPAPPGDPPTAASPGGVQQPALLQLGRPGGGHRPLRPGAADQPGRSHAALLLTPSGRPNGFATASKRLRHLDDPSPLVAVMPCGRVSAKLP